MRYIIDYVVNSIAERVPNPDGETMVMVNGFEDLGFYEELAREISAAYEVGPLTTSIKLAGKKWTALSANSDTITINSMLNHEWVANEESITYYRNQHEKNILVLLGAEDEDDTGGLKNCYTITPETVLESLSGKYSQVFAPCFLSELSEKDAKDIDKMYKCIFEFAAPDICKLSETADRWGARFTSFDEFIADFCEELPNWGLPCRIMELPKRNEIEKSGNFLEEEYKFISRGLFKTLTRNRYVALDHRLAAYDDEDGEYSSTWPGWNSQAGCKGYTDFCETVLSFARGENIAENKEQLLKTDYAIIDDILNVKLKKASKTKSSEHSVSGEPLNVFLYALLFVLQAAKKRGTADIATISFRLNRAEVVTGYTDTDDDEKQDQLRKVWENICVHTDGIFKFIDNPNWSCNGNEVSIICENEDFFDVNRVLEYMGSGDIRTATSTNTINKIRFTVRALDSNDNVIADYNENGKPDDFEILFCWKFKTEAGWLHDFSDIIRWDFSGLSEAIPIGTFSKIKSAMFVKSEEEFFDLYDEEEASFDFNLLDWIDNREVSIKSGNVISEPKFRFENLGSCFIELIRQLKGHGFYRCLNDNVMQAYIGAYNTLAETILDTSFPENQQWIFDAFIHAFNIESNTDFLNEEEDTECSIVPPWHPAALQKLRDQKIFILDAAFDAWETHADSNKALNLSDVLMDIFKMAEIHSSVDLFPARGAGYFGVLGTYGAFSVYGDSRQISKMKLRVRDIVRKEAIYDDDFKESELTRMNDDAGMIYDVIRDYVKAFPSAEYNLSLVFINPSELQPIIAAVYHYTEELRKGDEESIINIRMTIMVRSENKGGRNYLAYWMDEYFSKQPNTYVRTYLNEYYSDSDLDSRINSNNDILFNMNLMRVVSFSFIPGTRKVSSPSECRFPIVYKPSPVSKTSKKRKIELSQAQFTAAFNHTQIVRYKRNAESVPSSSAYMAVSESSLEKDSREVIDMLHKKAYWVVCIDRVMDGALLKEADNEKYSIIGFSTGKGTYGQYNLTITARSSILDTLRRRLFSRINQLFHWDSEIIDGIVDKLITESTYLDGISLLSAINHRDYNINEFMAYVLTSMRERQKRDDSEYALRIIVHLDSYKHWFENSGESSSRPDFLMLTVLSSENILKLKATVIECKISSVNRSLKHKETALKQVAHGLEQLRKIFDPQSKSLERRYWFSQLYRALVFAQVTFSDNTEEFENLSGKLRAILDGDFEIEWNGEILGYWFDMSGTAEKVYEIGDGILAYDIPQLRIQNILTGTSGGSFVNINEDDIEPTDEDNLSIQEMEKQLREKLVRPTVSEGRKSSVKRSESTEEPAKKGVAPETKEKTEPVTEAAESRPSAAKDNVTASAVPDLEPLVDLSGKSDPEAQAAGESEFSGGLEDIRIQIGTDRSGGGVFWEYGNPQLANRHLLITGTSGQGKTYSIQTMLYEVSKSNISTVIFDYTEGFRDDQLEKKFKEKMDGRIDSRIVYFTGVPVNPFKRNDIEVAGMKAPEKISDVAQRIANILTHVYSFGEQQFSSVYEACRLGLEKHGDDMNMAYFEQELNESTNKAAKTAAAKMAPFFHSVDFKEGDFDWEDILYCPDGRVTIFQLTNFVREIQVIITEFLLWDMWHFTKKYGNKDHPFVVVLDEAQNLSHTLSSPSGMILTEGRKFGWSAWYATQSLKILSDDEIIRLMQAAFKLYFKPTDEEVISMARQLNPADFNEWRAPLTKLKKGQCIVVGSRIQKDGRFGAGKPTITSVTPFEERD